MASEVVVALIGGGAGLATGVVGSLFAPWANWGVEKQRLKRHGRVQRVKEWRKGIRDLRSAEGKHGVPQVALTTDTQGGKLSTQWDSKIPDPDLVNVQTKPWFQTLKRELSKESIKRIEELEREPLPARAGELPKYLDDQVSAIESDKWRLL